MPPLDETLEALYLRTGHLVLRRARRLLGNDADARDVLQDVFLELARRRPDLTATVTTWLYSVTTHQCLNRLRSRTTRARLLEAQGPPLTARPPLGETRAEAVELLARLPREAAELAIYVHVDEMTHEEIAEVLGCSRRHVGNLVRRLEALVLEVAT